MTYAMSESTGNCSYISARRVPLDVCYTVVFDCVHELKVGVQVLLLVVLIILRLLKAEVPEVEIEGLL
jgi:hypothetical protein